MVHNNIIIISAFDCGSSIKSFGWNDKQIINNLISDGLMKKEIIYS